MVQDVPCRSAENKFPQARAAVTSHDQKIGPVVCRLAENLWPNLRARNRRRNTLALDAVPRERIKDVGNL